MFKFFVKLILFILLLGVGGLFIVKRPDGQPWLDITDLRLSLGRQLRSLQYSVESKTSELRQLAQKTNEKKEGNTTVYKWRGEDGTWQYSDEAQLDHQVQVLSIDPNTNLIPSAAPPVSKGDTDGTLYDQHLPSEVSPEKISSLAEEALRARRLQEARYQDINSLP